MNMQVLILGLVFLAASGLAWAGLAWVNRRESVSQRLNQLAGANADA